MRILFRRTVLAFLMLPALSVHAPAAENGAYSVEYTGYSHGLTVLKLAGSLAISPVAYTAHVTFHTAGLIGFMVHSDNDSTAEGMFQGAQAQPSLFEGHGNLRGTERATRIEYTGGNPVIRLLTPPAERERTPVPAQDTLHTIDTLSAAALLVHQVATTGHCDGSATTFDGRRLSILTAHTTGEEVLRKTDRSIFAGQALRCDFDGRQTGGFVTNENEDALRKPRHGTAWLAPILPNAPPVPVRVIFDNKILGEVTLYLTSVHGADELQAAKAAPSVAR
jgi:hypothetical protein